MNPFSKYLLVPMKYWELYQALQGTQPLRYLTSLAVSIRGCLLAQCELQAL